MLDGYKTYLAALMAVILAVAYAIIAWTNNQEIDIQAIITALVALAVLFLRKGIKDEIKTVVKEEK